jgi:hypothetical protein
MTTALSTVTAINASVPDNWDRKKDVAKVSLDLTLVW